MDTTVLFTKIFIPKLPAKVVNRPHITKRLTAGLSGGKSLTLLSAPAGYGKSTLLAEWIASNQYQVAWVSLDDHDNDPRRFWSYCVAALQTVLSDLAGQSLLESLELIKQNDHQQFLTTLVNTVVVCDQSLILVLDDYYMISSQIIHEEASFLIEHIPSSMHLVIATRTDPPLQLSRLRVRGQITEGAD
jgi:LuxR family transcriptional regulator, maltose regulon positive regulatory protein